MAEVKQVGKETAPIVPVFDGALPCNLPTTTTLVPYHSLRREGFVKRGREMGFEGGDMEPGAIRWD
jgi:hypothetical protein